MADTLFMAIDLGTSFIKAGVYTDGSDCIAVAMEPVKDYRPGPGIFIQKGEELFASVLACMKKVTEQVGDKAGEIAAISFTGQMSGFMGVDKDWNDITTWSCSLDSRYMPYAQKQMKELKGKFKENLDLLFPLLMGMQDHGLRVLALPTRLVRRAGALFVAFSF